MVGKTSAAPIEQHDTAVHVAQVLREGVGAVRWLIITLEALPLDEELVARAVAADVKLTHIPAGLLAEGQVATTVTLQCMRCLEDFDAPMQATFADEYRPTIDLTNGHALATAAEGENEEDFFAISDAHVLNLRESLRQAIVLALPMAPHCREDCPGLPESSAAGADAGDARLAVLEQLLRGNAEATTGADDAPRDGRTGGR
jgi:uncharacterized protein